MQYYYAGIYVQDLRTIFERPVNGGPDEGEIFPDNPPVATHVQKWEAMEGESGYG